MLCVSTAVSNLFLTYKSPRDGLAPSSVLDQSSLRGDQSGFGPSFCLLLFPRVTFFAFCFCFGFCFVLHLVQFHFVIAFRFCCRFTFSLWFRISFGFASCFAFLFLLWLAISWFCLLLFIVPLILCHDTDLTKQETEMNKGIIKIKTKPRLVAPYYY